MLVFIDQEDRLLAIPGPEKTGVSFTPIIDPDNPSKLESCFHTLGDHLLIDYDRGTLGAKKPRRCQHHARGNIGRLNKVRTVLPGRLMAAWTTCRAFHGSFGVTVLDLPFEEGEAVKFDQFFVDGWAVFRRNPVHVHRREVLLFRHQGLWLGIAGHDLWRIGLGLFLRE